MFKTMKVLISKYEIKLAISSSLDQFDLIFLFRMCTQTVAFILSMIWFLYEKGL